MGLSQMSTAPAAETTAMTLTAGHSVAKTAWKSVSTSIHRNVDDVTNANPIATPTIPTTVNAPMR